MDSVLAAIDAKMVKPAADRPYEGMISIHSEISPMASSEYEQGRCVRSIHQVARIGLTCDVGPLMRRLLSHVCLIKY
jgi:exosome complex RNA-binding protein Rrp42 (RNase PH superfamily)